MIETLLLRALVYQARGDEAPAQRDLARALALAAPEGYVQIFVAEGEAMHRLLAAFGLTLPTAASDDDHAIPADIAALAAERWAARAAKDFACAFTSATKAGASAP